MLAPAATRIIVAISLIFLTSGGAGGKREANPTRRGKFFDTLKQIVPSARELLALHLP
jgi:hypothetical protein